MLCVLFLFLFLFSFFPNYLEFSVPGTTQGAIFEAARRDGWELGYGPLYPQDLFESDGVWLSSSVRLLAPVTRLNGTALAHDAQLTHQFLEYLAQG